MLLGRAAEGRYLLRSEHDPRLPAAEHARSQREGRLSGQRRTRRLLLSFCRSPALPTHAAKPLGGDPEGLPEPSPLSKPPRRQDQRHRSAEPRLSRALQRCPLRPGCRPTASWGCGCPDGCLLPMPGADSSGKKNLQEPQAQKRSFAPVLALHSPHPQQSLALTQRGLEEASIAPLSAAPTGHIQGTVSSVQSGSCSKEICTCTLYWVLAFAERSSPHQTHRENSWHS